jgi:molybdenum cofactor cytidylyltransferase
MGEPKALVRFGRHFFLETIVANFRTAGIENPVVVLGHDAAHIQEKLGHLASRFVINKDYPCGQFSSVQTGVAALPADVEGVFLALVDQPQIGSQIIAMLKEAFLATSQKIVIPTCNGRRGHPPILPRALFEEIASAPPTENAAAIIRRHRELIREIETGDESILWNINTKQELQNLRARFNF